MLRSVLSLALVLGSASAASAGGYLGSRYGTTPAASGDMSFREDGRSGRLQIGQRFGRLAVEGLGSTANRARGRHAIHLDVVRDGRKVQQPLGDKFEVFGRPGLQHSSLIRSETMSRSPGGPLFGGGFEYR